MNAPDPTPPSGEIDPTLLAMRVKRVRQQEKALAAVKHTLSSYISEHVPNRCEYATGGAPCQAEPDGFILVSCGHYLFTCAEHGSRVLAQLATRDHVVCTRILPPLHSAPAVGVSREWVGLS